jgi:predicted metal-dependent peptidase
MDAVEDLMKRAMIKSNTDYSQLPGSVKDLLNDIKTRRAELNYKGLILAAIKRSASGHDRKGTWTRKNKRYGFAAPGTKNAELPKLDIYLDTSGSISIEELSSFLEIVDEFLRVGVRKCTINCFHTSHYLRKPYKSGDREMLKKSVESGGTDLTDVFKSIVKNRSDLSIIISDGFYADVPVESMLKPGQTVPTTLFIISKGGSQDHPLLRIGNTVRVPDGSK